MKYIAKNIAAGFKKDWPLNIIILAIQVVSVWIFLFSFGMFNSYINPNEPYSDVFRSFQIDFLKEECITAGELRSRLGELEEKMGEDFYLISIMCTSQYHMENDGLIPLCSHIMTREAYQDYARQGVSFGEGYESLMGAADSNAFVEADSHFKNIIGDEYLIGGKSFDVKYNAKTAYTQIKFQSLPDEAVIFRMQISVPNIPNRAKAKEMTQMFSDFFGCSEGSAAAPYHIGDFLGKQEIQSNMLLYALISILIHANLQLIFIHLIHKRGKGQEAFILTGCSTLRFRLIVFGEVLLFLAAGTAAGWFSFNGLLLGYVTKAIENFPILFETVLVKYGCCCYIGIALVFSILNILFNIKSSGKAVPIGQTKGGD